MLAYCGNNPANYRDDTGHLFEWFEDLWDFVCDIASDVGEYIYETAVDNWHWMCRTSGYWLDFVGDAASYVGLDGFAEFEYCLSDFWLDLGNAKTENNESVQTYTYIYRYHSSKTRNLSPRSGIDYDGLSFTTTPPKQNQFPAVVTTVEAVNATGILRTIQNGNHVSVVPINGTVIEWMDQGQNSIWSQQLASIVIEIGG